MKTTSGKVIVKPNKNDEVSKGGVILPDYSIKTLSGVVIYGSVTFGNNNVIAINDKTVIYEKIDAREVEVDGEMLHVIREEDILVIL